MFDFLKATKTLIYLIAEQLNLQDKLCVIWNKPFQNKYHLSKSFISNNLESVKFISVIFKKVYSYFFILVKVRCQQSVCSISF